MKILVLGLGSIGKRHTKNLISITRDPIYVYDKEINAYDFIEKDDNGQIHVVTDDDIKKGTFDAAIIATPNSTHADYLIELSKKTKALFVEKPIASSLNGIEDVLKKLDENGNTLMVGCNMRFHPGAIAVKKIIDEKQVGKLVFVHSEYGYYLPYQRPGVDYKKIYAASEEEGGIILDTIHEINLLRWFAGEINEYDCWGYHTGTLEISGYEMVFSRMKFEKGAIGEVRVDYLQKVRRKFYELVFEKGTILWEGTGKNPECCKVKLYNESDEKWTILYENSDYDLNQMYVDELQAFIECAKSNSKTENSGWEGYKDLQVAIGLKEKAKQSDNAKWTS